MNRDPLHRKIVEALGGDLEGNAFEECAVALLGKAHPNLAPMPGGNDAGMDGAFGTPEGPFPLICTVKKDVIGNFRDNISTYLSKCQGPRIAVVATSQHLSNKKKRNLKDEAAKLGVTIANIYDAPYFANALYRDPKWRLQLLGITGELPALSALPRVGRFVQPDILIGRDQDLAWLQQAQGDVLLVGPPGSGKTYLHQHLASQGECLFAVDNSLDRLADAIREQQPSIIVVDDAHFCLGLLEDLKRLRAELGAAYFIHLNCWPRHESSVQRILTIPDASVRRLLPLKRQAILDIIKHIGIHGPDWLQYLLIEQADGKPGLAVALAELCNSADVERIWSGEETAAQLLGDLRLVPSERERCVLAAFAVGGDAGMPFGLVATALGLSELDLKQITAGLGSGGIVDEAGDDCLQVRPPAIRPVLIRDVFYGGAASINIAPLLGGMRSVACTARELLSARQRGANISLNMLEPLVRSSRSQDAWEHFAHVDAECAKALLDNYPDKVCAAAPGLLQHFPGRTLHALLDAIDANLIQRPGAVEHPERRISEWLFPFNAAPEVTVDRRQILLSVLEERVKTNKIGTGTSFAWALGEILQATFDTVRPSPANNLEFTSIRGVAAHATLEKIAGLWPRLKLLLRHMPTSSARRFFDQLESWCMPQRLSIVARLSDETFELVRKHGREMLSDVLALPQCNRAWRTWAAQKAKWGELDLQIEVDAFFDALFADRDHPDNWEQAERKRQIELQTLTDDLMKSPMDQVLRFFSEIQAESQEFGHRKGTGCLQVAFWRVAERCDDPAKWIDALIAGNASAELLIPFVDRLSLGDPVPYYATLKHLLNSVDYQPLAISRVLCLAEPNENLLAEALKHLADPDLAEHLWLRDPGIPLTVMARLLEHPNKLVRAAAAIGEWQREPAGSVRPELEQQWRAAMPDVGPSHYALQEIFKKDSSLAFEWLHAQLATGERRLSIHDHALGAAAKSLTKDQRALLIRLFTRHNYSDDCFDLVMGDDAELFSVWLEHQTDDYLRLRPLDRDVSERWERMAQLAFDAGISPEDVAENCTLNHWVATSGPISSHLLSRIPYYEGLAAHSDPRFRTVGTRVLEWLRPGAQKQLEREQRAEVYGD